MIFAFFIIFNIAVGHATTFNNYIGDWQFKNGTIVKVIQCDNNKLCGYIASGRYKGFRLISPSKLVENKWVGKITNPRNNNVYDENLYIKNNKLILRGYVWIPLFGNTVVLTKYH